MDFDPKQIPFLHENPMYIMEQNQRFQHICDIIVQVSNIEKHISSYIYTGDHMCSILKDVINTSSEIEFVCTNQDFGLILEAFDVFQDSLRNHFKEIQDCTLIEIRNIVKKDFPELVESKKTYSKNLERYYQVQDHYLSLPKKSKTKIFKERQNEYRKAFTDSSTSFFEFVIKLDALEAKISNLIGTFLVNFPKSFLKATKPSLEKQIKTTEKIVNSICPDYKSIQKREQLCKQGFLSSIPQYFKRINSHLGSSIDNDSSTTSSSQIFNQPINSSENQFTSSAFFSDSKGSSQNLTDSPNESNQIFSTNGGGDSTRSNKDIMTKQGYMWKRCGKVTKTWERRYFVCNQGVLSYSVSVETATNPSNTIQLVFASVQPNENEERPYVFNLITQAKVFTFQAPSQLDYDEWIKAIQNGIATGLSTYGDDTTTSNITSSNTTATIDSIPNENNNNENNDNSGSIQIEENENADNNSKFYFSDIPEMSKEFSNSAPKSSNNTVMVEISPSRFISTRKNSLPSEYIGNDNSATTPNNNNSVTGHKTNLNHSSDFNLLLMNRRQSTTTRKPTTIVNPLGSTSESIPKIPGLSTSPFPTFATTQCTCADCGNYKAEWCIINRGLVICENCAGIHRSLPNVSTVRSLKLDRIDKYNSKMLNILANNVLNSFMEASLILYENNSHENDETGEYCKRINSSSSPEERNEFIKKKYVDREFVDPTFILTTNKERQKEQSKRKEKENKLKEENENENNIEYKEKVKDKELKTKTKNKDKSKNKDKDRDDDNNNEFKKERKDRKMKNKNDVGNNNDIDLTRISSTHSLGDSNSNFLSLKGNDDMNNLEAEDDDIESLEPRKHQGKRRQHKQQTATRRRSLTTSQNQDQVTELNQHQSPHHHRHKSDVNESESTAPAANSSANATSGTAEVSKKHLPALPFSKKQFHHDIFNAIQTQDLLELMKIAFMDGLSDATLKGNFRPIHAAACIGNPILIVAIIENDIFSIEQADDHGWTALSYAAYHGNEKAIDALISYGAKVSGAPGSDLSSNPLYIAKELHHENIIKKLSNLAPEIANVETKGDPIVPLNTDFVPQEIPPSMIVVDDVPNSPQSIKPMTDADMSQIQQALKNMSKRPRMRRKSVTDAHRAINNPDEY